MVTYPKVTEHLFIRWQKNGRDTNQSKILGKKFTISDRKIASCIQNRSSFSCHPSQAYPVHLDICVYSLLHLTQSVSGSGIQPHTFLTTASKQVKCYKSGGKYGWHFTAPMFFTAKKKLTTKFCTSLKSQIKVCYTE